MNGSSCLYGIVHVSISSLFYLFSCVCCVFLCSFPIQILPPSFSKSEPGRLFEALYPRVEGPADTRHFVEEVTEEDEDVRVDPILNHHSDKFIEF